jgi:beta-lactamase class A
MEAIEKRKETLEAEAEDSEEIIEGWDKAAADAAYQRYQEEVAQQLAEAEAAEAAAVAAAAAAAAAGTPAVTQSYYESAGWIMEEEEWDMEVTSPHFHSLAKKARSSRKRSGRVSAWVTSVGKGPWA